MLTTSFTTLGTIGGTATARVDGAGRVSAADGSWSFGWSIGAEDRWYDPGEVANVRQHCLSPAPVVETRMRVPGGDIVHRAYALHVAGADGGSEWIVVEIENDSGVPVALATSRPVGARLVVPRPPSDERDGEDVFTLTHRATIRFLVGLDGDDVADADPATLPPLDVVVSGWRTQLDRGARLVVPDERFQDAIALTRAHLLVDAATSVSPALAVVLDEYGLHGDARSIVARLVEFRFDRRRGSFGDLASNTAVVATVARHQELAPDDDFAVTIVDRFAAGVQQLLDAVKPRRFGRRSTAPDPAVVAALRAAPGVLAAAGEADAARSLTADLATISADAASAPDPVDVVDDLLSTAGPTWTWTTPDGTDRAAATSIAFATAARSMLVDEHADGLRLLGTVPGRWNGQPVEAHDVPTRHGAVSFAVRWHGENPALLWQVDGESPVTITCGLDTNWSTTEREGETLLRP